MNFGPFGATPPGPAPRGHMKIPNVFLQSSSIGLLWEYSLNGLGAMVSHYGRTGRGGGGGGVLQYPRFFFEKRWDNHIST